MVGASSGVGVCGRVAACGCRACATAELTQKEEPQSKSTIVPGRPASRRQAMRPATTVVTCTMQRCDTRHGSGQGACRSSCRRRTCNDTPSVSWVRHIACDRVRSCGVRAVHRDRAAEDGHLPHAEGAHEDAVERLSRGDTPWAPSRDRPPPTTRAPAAAAACHSRARAPHSATRWTPRPAVAR
jgi:hypothetical protein